MKRISKKKISIILAVLVAVLIVGGVSAYLTDTDSKTNVFTVGSVKISLNEPNWNQSNEQYVIPGQPIQKDF
jgi:predicted ribosomally synthesized peptide with SipW-like signal peptide